LSIERGTIYLATLRTEKGDILIELFADKAPLAVNSFVFLARAGFYDNTPFFRVIEDLAQGGDPTGTGTGGPGYAFQKEIVSDLKFDRPGRLGMANSGPDSNGSQFFITLEPTPWLDGNYTIVGQVVEGIEVLGRLTRRDPEQNPASPGDTLFTVEIAETNTSRLPTPGPTSTPFAPNAAVDDHFMASLPAAERVNYWNTPPDGALQPGAVYLAIFHTEVGEIVVELLPSLAPNNVNSFIALARAGYYDGTHFYQVLEGRAATGGDPLDNGRGTPGYLLNDELVPGAFGDKGWLGSFQLSPNSNSGQFFFTLAPAPWLAGRFTPLGRVVAGIDVLDRIERRDPTTNPTSPGTLLHRVDIRITSISRLPTPMPPPTPFAPLIPPDGSRPLSLLDPIQRNHYYNAPPPMQIDTAKDYIAILRTEVGDITIDLYEKLTPLAVNNFVVLALNGFYDGLTFHEVIPGIVAQGGSPDGTGQGTPGYHFADEFVPALLHDRPGRVSMANYGPDTNCSQFFIAFVAAPQLDGRYTLFGQVIEGLENAAKLAPRNPATATEAGTRIVRVDIETR